MMYGFSICSDARSALSNAELLAGSVRSASIECPESIERNAQFIRETVNLIREELAAVEAKLPKPREVRDAA